jgi:hypothetical protein
MTRPLSIFAAALCASTALAIVPASAQRFEQYPSSGPTVAAQAAKRAAQIEAVRQREAQALAAQRERNASQDRAAQQQINPLDPPPDGIYQDVWDRMSPQDKADWAQATPQDKAFALQIMRQRHRNNTPSTPNTSAQNAFLAWCQNPATLADVSRAIEGAASTTEPVHVLRIHGAALGLHLRRFRYHQSRSV